MCFLHSLKIRLLGWVKIFLFNYQSFFFFSIIFTVLFIFSRSLVFWAFIKYFSSFPTELIEFSKFSELFIHFSILFTYKHIFFIKFSSFSYFLILCSQKKTTRDRTEHKKLPHSFHFFSRMMEKSREWDENFSLKCFFLIAMLTGVGRKHWSDVKHERFFFQKFCLCDDAVESFVWI